MILVYQMAKVASRSWVEAATPATAGSGNAPLHAHYIVPENRARIAAGLAKQPTLANMLMPKNLLRVGAATEKRIDVARRTGEPIRLITGMREPVARSISWLAFMADFYGDVSRPLNPRATVEPDFFMAALRDLWRLVLADQEPADNFQWLAWYFTRAYRAWFDEEFRPSFGIDVLGPAFDSAAGAQLLGNGQVKALVYRVEDMLPSPRESLLRIAREFLNIALPSMPKVNTGETRRSRELHAAVFNHFRLPSDWLEKIYAAPTVRHFYSEEEIAGFIRKWSER